jgi:hypothetical protein
MDEDIRSERRTVATYLNIAGITEEEPLFGLTPEPNNRTLDVVIGVGDTASRLMQAGQQGELLPVVVAVTDDQMYALDSAYVTGFHIASGSEPQVVYLTFQGASLQLV